MTNEERSARLNQLADTIEMNDPKLFNMKVFAKQSECGTVCCIAGWAVWVFGTKEERKEIEAAYQWGTFDRAQEYLGLTFAEASWLFHGGFSKWGLNRLHRISRASALKYLRKMAKEAA